MTDNHPMTPPRELVDRLQDLGNLDAIELAYQAGADAELEACYSWVTNELNMPGSAICLREDRRPKPPSLKERALAALNKIKDEKVGPTAEEKLIRRALEALPE